MRSVLVGVLLLGAVACDGDGVGGIFTPSRDQSSRDDVPDEAGAAVATWEGNLSDGVVLDDLEFLEDHYCVPGTENENFNGAHVYYTYEQDAAVQVWVQVNPKAGVDVSLLVSQAPGGTSGTGWQDVVDPCEVSADLSRDNNPGEKESVKMTSLDRPYHLIIGIIGAQREDEGEFEVEIYEMQ
ncbi:MAG: hypothetical protein ACI9MC_001809 [Kiritimatiellia bacterium]|jgi:hypothetical protein